MSVIKKKTDMLCMYYRELEYLLESMGEKPYRANQIMQWINRGIKSFDQMTNLPQALRKRLKESCTVGTMTLKRKLVSSADGTVKYLLEVEGGDAIECVLMRYSYGYTVCISSQAGCRMGCAFCASAAGGYIRNLSPGEMHGQVLLPLREQSIKPSNIVVMGIGEPFDNYDNLIKFIKIINSPKGLNIGARRITVSTCGIVPGIIALSGEGLQVNLSVSLHAANNRKRTQIMPINKKYSIDKIIGACKIYTEATNRRVTFEYILISGFNDSKKDALELADRIAGLLSHVNLIRMNEIEESRHRASGVEKVKRFKEVLESRGIGVTIRRKTGADLAASCGQLRLTANRRQGVMQ